jgi:hypothetical protein
MTDHRIPAENVSSLTGGDGDVLVLEERLERLLAAPIDQDAAWSLVRARIGLESGVVPLRSGRRRWSIPLLAIAAALLVSGVALAAVAQRGGSSDTHARRGGAVPHLISGALERPDARGEDPSPGTASGPGVSGTSPAPVAVAPTDTRTSSPSAGPSAGSTQEPKQDQGDGQGQGEESPDPSGQDQQDQSGTGDGSDVLSGTSSLPSSATDDQ